MYLLKLSYFQSCFLSVYNYSINNISCFACIFSQSDWNGIGAKKDLWWSTSEVKLTIYKHGLRESSRSRNFSVFSKLSSKAWTEADYFLLSEFVFKLAMFSYVNLELYSSNIDQLKLFWSILIACSLLQFICSCDFLMNLLCLFVNNISRDKYNCNVTQQKVTELAESFLLKFHPSSSKHFTHMTYLDEASKFIFSLRLGEISDSANN